MLYARAIDLPTDRDTLLELHCRAAFESDSPWARAMPFERYRAKWLSTYQPEQFLASLARSMKDKRTIAEIWEDNGVIQGYLWVTFRDVSGYNVTIAEVNDISVVEKYWRCGIGSAMLAHAHQLACERGAHVLRSETGIENNASQGLHAKSGFFVYGHKYEKLLTAESESS